MCSSSPYSYIAAWILLTRLFRKDATNSHKNLIWELTLYFCCTKSSRKYYCYESTYTKISTTRLRNLCLFVYESLMWWHSVQLLKNFSKLFLFSLIGFCNFCCVQKKCQLYCSGHRKIFGCQLVTPTK